MRPRDGSAGDTIRVSPRRFQAQLGEIEYSPGDLVKKVKCKGEITWRNQTYYVGNAFAGEVVALRPTQQDHCWEVYFCHQRLGRIDLRQEAKSKHHYLPIREPRGGQSR